LVDRPKIRYKRPRAAAPSKDAGGSRTSKEPKAPRKKPAPLNPKRSHRITLEQWQEARARREAGESITGIARWLQVTHALVSRRAKAEQWPDGSDISELLDRKVAEKVSGIVTSHDPKRLADAVNAEAERRAAVELRHRAEWDEHKDLLVRAITAPDPKEAFERAKLAKITAETITIRQQAERKAWRLDRTEAPAPTLQQVRMEDWSVEELKVFIEANSGGLATT
jgi:hypothetical protein